MQATKERKYTMFKIIAEIKEIEFDHVIDQMLELAKNHPQAGMQIPAFINADMIKQMPQEMKNEMVVKALTAEKQKGIDMLQNMAARMGITMQVKSLLLEAPNTVECALRLQLEGSVAEYDRAIDVLMPRLLKEEQIPAILGTSASAGITTAEAINVMKQKSETEKEFYLVKTLSLNKEILKQELEQMAKLKNVALTMGVMRFMLPK